MEPEDLARILDDLGNRLGPTGEYVFGLAIRQVYINAAISTVLLVGAVVFAVVAIPRLYRWQQAADSYNSDREIVTALSVLGIVALVGVFALNFILVAPAALNPEYAAIRDILGAIGGSR